MSKFTKINQEKLNGFLSNYTNEVVVSNIVVDDMVFDVYNDFSLEGDKVIAMVAKYNDENCDDEYLLRDDMLEEVNA